MPQQHPQTNYSYASQNLHTVRTKPFGVFNKQRQVQWLRRPSHGHTAFSMSEDKELGLNVVFSTNYSFSYSTMDALLSCGTGCEQGNWPELSKMLSKTASSLHTARNISPIHNPTWPLHPATSTLADDWSRTSNGNISDITRCKRCSGGCRHCAPMYSPQESNKCYIHTQLNTNANT